jgi:hypothetical protein
MAGNGHEADLEHYLIKQRNVIPAEAGIQSRQEPPVALDASWSWHDVILF